MMLKLLYLKSVIIFAVIAIGVVDLVANTFLYQPTLGNVVAMSDSMIIGRVLDVNAEKDEYSAQVDCTYWGDAADVVKIYIIPIMERPSISKNNTYLFFLNSISPSSDTYSTLFGEVFVMPFVENTLLVRNVNRYTGYLSIGGNCNLEAYESDKFASILKIYEAIQAFLALRESVLDNTPTKMEGGLYEELCNQITISINDINLIKRR